MSPIINHLLFALVICIILFIIWVIAYNVQDSREERKQIKYMIETHGFSEVAAKAYVKTFRDLQREWGLI